ncbi:unnamed protein product [Effrenium voratum]|nr:unnamed protein product [Effrenium voratum]
MAMEDSGMKIQLLHMPHEVCAGIVWSLGIGDVGQLAPSCKLFGLETADAELWFHVFMRCCWPPSGALLAFAESTTTAIGIDWRARLQARTEATPTIVVDIGRGYTKYTVTHGLRGRWEVDGATPKLVQLCSSPTHPPDCGRDEQLQYIHHQLDREFLRAAADPCHRLHKAALAPNAQLAPGTYALWSGAEDPCIVRLHCQETDHWSVEILMKRERTSVRPETLTPLRRAHDLPILIGEPFIITANRHQDVRGWDNSIRMQLGNDRPGAVQVVSQAQMALWAHGVDHGIVVNIGQQQTIAIPVVRGEVVADCSAMCSIGSADLTQVMVSLMSRRAPSFDSSLMTWCRDLKEAHCYVSPPGRGCMRARLAAGDDFGIRPIDVELPEYAGLRHEQRTMELAQERVLVPEVLFEANRGQSLPTIILACANSVSCSGRCDQDGVRNLLRQVVIVGGAADFPGIRPRVEYEVRSLLQQPQFEKLRGHLESADDVYVLNPPLDPASNPLVSPRFVPLFGGCVRAASSNEKEGTGALRSLPLMEMPQDEPSFTLQRRLFALQLPHIFRTGGGGGEDDHVWQMLESDQEGMEGLEEEEEEIDMSSASSSEEESPSSHCAPDAQSSRAPEHPPERPRSGGKGSGRKGRGKGKASSRYVWRPVSREE